MTESINLYHLLKPNQLRNSLMSTQPSRFPLPAPAAPRTLEFDLRITVPADAPMVDLAQALTNWPLPSAAPGATATPPGAERGRFEVEARP